jgi:peptide/nickel transport system substrate-binding protein
MVAFNTWYYSFSPTIANYIATHSAERAVVKVTLYPLVGILYLASTLYSPTSAYPEIAVLLSGLLASSLIGAFYLGLPLSLIRSKVRRLRYLATLEGYLGLALLGGLIALTIGEVLDSITLLMISSVAIVLSTMLLAATITSDQITKKLKTRL